MMNMSPWKRMVTLLKTSGSATPFQVEDSIRQVPWSLSKSGSARLRDATPTSPFGDRDLEQPVTLNNATTGIDTRSHLITTPPIGSYRVGGVYGTHHRNRNWVPKIESRLNTFSNSSSGKSSFLAVMAKHGSNSSANLN